MSAHTPGPWTWRVIPNLPPHERERLFEIVFHHPGGGADGRGGPASLATCDGDNAVWLAEGAAEANANLIAAAPELLAALKAALESTRCRNMQCDHSWHAAGRAAIAKAEGSET